MNLSPQTARKVFVWQMVFFGFILTLAALDNTYTVLADRARVGDSLPLWKPMVWEFSSNLVTWLLIPAIGWWLARFPLTREAWWRSLPAHVLATAPFSCLHTAAMVVLRKVSYGLAHDVYDFGPFWDNWGYEYRKDALTYAVIIGALLGFRVYGLWLDVRARAVTTHALADNAHAQADNGHARADNGIVTPEQREADAPATRVMVRKRNREFILDSVDIDRIDADGNYVVIHAAGESYRLRDSLEGLVRRLGEQRFARVHRGHVVNIDRIREIQPWDHGDYRILLKDGSFVNLSRRYRSRLNELVR